MRAGQKVYDLTPDAPFYLIGYANKESRKAPARGVHDPIYANALLLESNQTEVFVASLDLIELEEEFCDQMRQELSERYGIRKENILLSVTHNHQSVRDYHHTWQSGVYNPAYEEFLKETIEKAYVECKAALREVEVYYGRKVITGYYGNRDHKGQLADNEVIRIEFRADGKAVAGIVNWAVHSTLLSPDNPYLSGELAGNTATELEKRLSYRPLFLLGAAGDCSTRNYAEKKDFEELEKFSSGLGREIAEIPVTYKLEAEYQKTEEAAYHICYDMEQYRPMYEEELRRCEELMNVRDAKVHGISPRFCKILIEKKLKNRHVDIRLTSDLISFGDLIFVTSEGELGSKFGLELKGIRPDKCVVIAGYTNGFQHYMMPAEEYGKGMEDLDSLYPKGEIEHYIDAIAETLRKL